MPTGPNDLAVLTCYFNPCSYERRLRNFLRFQGSLQATLFVLDLDFDFCRYKLPPSERVVTLRGGAPNLMWQKERLLNILLERIPAAFTKIAWVDADILFDNQTWAFETSAALSQHRVVQLFDSVRQLDEHDEDLPELCGNVAKGIVAVNQFNLETGGTNWILGHPGFGWAARRDILEGIGFPDAFVLGTGDLAIAVASLGLQNEPRCRALFDGFSAGLNAWYSDWADRFHARVQGRIGYVRGSIRHLFHGPLKNRRYRERDAILKHADYRPAIDLELDDNLLWRWRNPQSALARGVAEYFAARNEDEVAVAS